MPSYTRGPRALPRSRAPLARHAVVTATVALALTGCGGSSDPATDSSADPSAAASPSESADAVSPEDAAAALQDAVDATVAARAFTVEGDAQLTIADQDLRLRTSGSVDYDAVISDLTLGVDQAGQSSEISILADGETLWAKVEGDNAPTLPPGKSWIEGPADQLGASSAFEPGGVLGVVLVLRGSTQAEVSGTDEVDGVPVTEYTTTLTYDDAVAAVGPDADTLESAFSLTGAASSLPFDVTVAVGEDGIIRDLDLELAGGDVPADGSYVLSLRDVGTTPEPPAAPAPATVLTGQPADQLLSQLIQP